jgi:hypothetical protein
MCYWLRDPQRREDHVTQVPADDGRQSFVRPRVVGALAALVALGATAAILLPAPTPAVSSEKATSTAAVSGPAVNDRSGVVIEQTSATIDDGVPSAATDVAARSHAGHCDHGL